MAEIFKPVPSIEGLEINHDGSIVYYQEQLKKICLQPARGRMIKHINLNKKRYTVSLLVYEAFIGKLPSHRKIHFIDGNGENTHYLNLGPKPCMMASFTNMKKVPGYDELYINNNGTVISQYNLEISIRKQPNSKNRYYAAACVFSGSRVQYTYVSILVAKAWLNWRGNGKIIHKDGDTLNNHFSNLQPYTMKQYGKRNKDILIKANKMRTEYACSIPKAHTKLVKERLLNGDSLKSIAIDYNCSDMAIVRFKKRHLSKQQIRQINEAKNINTTHTPEKIINAIIEALKKGERQIDLAHKYKLSPTIVCRINRKYIRNK